MSDPMEEPIDAELLASLCAPAAPTPPSRQGLMNLLAALGDPAATASAPDGVAPPPHPFPGFARRFARLFAITQEAADSILASLQQKEVWFENGPIAWFHFEPGVPGGHAGVIRCAPGIPFPRHRHIGEEHSLILRGVVRDEETGARYLPGDLLAMPAGSRHTFSIEEGQECWFAVLLLGEWPEFELD